MRAALAAEAAAAAAIEQRERQDSSSLSGSVELQGTQQQRRSSSSGSGAFPRGSRIKVYSHRYDAWYECTVVRRDAAKGMHCCKYDITNEEQWHDLSSKRVQVIGGSDDVRADVRGDMDGTVRRASTAEGSLQALRRRSSFTQ
eukprot:4427-Heterococcus_DN1.PRE.1